MTSNPHDPSGEIDLKQFMVGDVCLASRTRRLSRILTRVYEEAMRDHGVTVTQFSLLTVISVNEPVTSADVGRRLDLEKSTLSRTVKKMIANGWLEDRRGGIGERGLVLTAHGRETLRNAIPAWHAIQEKTKAQIGQSAGNALDEMIDAVHGL